MPSTRPSNAYTAALLLLSRRELSTEQLRQRLKSRRRFSATDIDETLERLQRERALDDDRVARACARTEANVKAHGRLRVLRKILSLGIDSEIAEAAVNEVFAELDEEVLLQRALRRALRGHSLDRSDRSQVRRLYARLIRQGFESSAIRKALKGGARLE